MTASKSTELHEAAEKAKQMKDQAGGGSKTPPHREAGQGGVKGPQVGRSDRSVDAQAMQTPNLKRSHTPRSGDS